MIGASRDAFKIGSHYLRVFQKNKPRLEAVAFKRGLFFWGKRYFRVDFVLEENH